MLAPDEQIHLHLYHKTCALPPAPRPVMTTGSFMSETLGSPANGIIIIIVTAIIWY